MKEFYTTKDGARILRDWGNEYEKHAKTATKAARAILPRLTIETGADFLGGLVYTSSSSFAALWNCNTQARLRAPWAAGLRAYFRGVAIDENGRAVLYWVLIDTNGDEVGDEFTTAEGGRV